MMDKVEFFHAEIPFTNLVIESVRSVYTLEMPLHFIYNETDEI